LDHESQGGTITCVDAQSLEVKQTIEVGGALEFAAEDPAKGQVFVNVDGREPSRCHRRKKHEVTTKLHRSRRAKARWPRDGSKNGLLSSAAENKSSWSMEAATGKVVSSVDIGEHCDGVAFDPEPGLYPCFVSRCLERHSREGLEDLRASRPLDGGRLCRRHENPQGLHHDGSRGEKDSVKLLVFAQK
jgi:hypothetical protein